VSVCAASLFALSVTFAVRQSGASTIRATTFLSCPGPHLIPFGDLATTVVIPCLATLKGPAWRGHEPSATWPGSSTSGTGPGLSTTVLIPAGTRYRPGEHGADFALPAIDGGATTVQRRRMETLISKLARIVPPNTGSGTDQPFPMASSQLSWRIAILLSILAGSAPTALAGSSELSHTQRRGRHALP